MNYRAQFKIVGSNNFITRFFNGKLIYVIFVWNQKSLIYSQKWDLSFNFLRQEMHKLILCAMSKFGCLIKNKTLEIWKSLTRISVLTVRFLLCNAFENRCILQWNQNPDCLCYAIENKKCKHPVWDSPALVRTLDPLKPFSVLRL